MTWIPVLKRYLAENSCYPYPHNVLQTDHMPLHEKLQHNGLKNHISQPQSLRGIENGNAVALFWTICKRNCDRYSEKLKQDFNRGTYGDLPNNFNKKGSHSCEIVHNSVQGFTCY